MNIRLYADKHGDKQTFIKIERSVIDHKESFWFSVLNENGATESHPYCFTNRERLEHLRDELNDLLMHVSEPIK